MPIIQRVFLEVFGDNNINFLVVGADSFLGSRLVSQFKRQGHNVIGTTRRPETIGLGRVFLDIRDSDNFQISGNECIFILAGVTNYGLCETYPEAWDINVKALPRMASRFLESGAFVFFVSTNSVFGGDHPWPREDDPHQPTIAYSRQKSASEAAIRNQAEKLGCLDQFAIIRLTKVVGANTPPFPQWLNDWKNDKVVRPFSDFIFAPLSLDFAAKSLVTLGERPIPGNLHLSGSKNITYFEFAKALAAQLRVSDSLIEPTTSVDRGIEVLYLPKYSGIDMKKTSELTGIFPETLESVVASLTAGEYAP